jgi:hypothetical protein
MTFPPPLGRGSCHPVRRARREDDGSFVMACEGGGEEIVARYGKERWDVRGLGAPATLTAGECGGFVLEVAEPGGGGGRTDCPVGLGRDAGLRFLLLDDGRLYRIVFRALAAPSVELHGWEVDGAYLTAHADGDDWLLHPTVSGEGLDDLRSMALLVTAEILDRERPWREERDERKA